MKPDPNPPNLMCTYRVTVGHASVEVRGHDPREAVRRARTQLCLEMPRMWDKIQTLGDDRFDVQRLS